MFGWLGRKGRMMRQVKQFMKAGQYDAAVKELDELTELYPDDREVGLYRAICLREEERFEEAVQDIQRIQHQYDQDATVWEMHGGLLFNLKRYSEALGPLTRALELDPRRQVARHSRAACLFLLKRSREAMEDCEEYLQRWPMDAHGYHLKASLHESLWEPEEGVKAADQGLAFDRKHLNLLIVKARLLCYAERPQEGLTAMDAAIAAGADADGFSVLRVGQLLKLKRFAEAIPFLNEFIRESHGRGCYLMRATAYEGLGKHDLALADHQAAARILAQLEQDIRRVGVVTRVALIQAGSQAFAPGRDDSSSLVLLTFDDRLSSDSERMLRLAAALFALKHKPLSENPILRRAASAISNDYGQEYRRQALPVELTDGVQCYAADMNIHRELLPERRLTEATRILSVVAEPGDAGRIQMLPVQG